MNETLGWILLGIGAVVVVGLIVYLVVKIIKNKWFNEIYDTLKAAIKEAEAKYPSDGENKYGEEKQAYVLEKVQEKCDELNIQFGFIVKLVIKTIQEIIAGYNVLIK